TTLTNGTLILNATNGLGGAGSSVAFNGGSLVVNADALVTGASTVNITQGVGSVISGTGNLTLSGNFGLVANTQVLTNNLSGGSLTFSGQFNMDTAADTTARRFVIYGSGTTNLTGSIMPTRAAAHDLYYDGSGTLNIALTGTSGQTGSLV